LYKRDVEYIVRNGEIIIVDEFTGRTMQGRRWSDGLHQAVEAKELVPITAATGQAARVTVQTYFRQYEHVCGMTGTAVQARRELANTYAISVSPIPTNRPCIRTGAPPRIFTTLAAKRQAVVQEVAKMHAAGRSVLVGTPSVDASEALSRALKECGIAHQVLNAHFHEQEAEIVTRAGQSQAVTIATNMAGRGTDIQLDEKVRAAGGLHVIATEMHSSARIDRQLVGRAARQGDPGSFQFFLSLEDELLRCLKPDKVARFRAKARPNADGQLSLQWLGLFRRTQRFLEKMHRKERKHLLKHERQRSDAHNHMGLDPFLELTE
jgi:preprotein translocase subunit SecA